VHVGLEVAAALRPRRAPGGRAAEEVGEDVAEAAKAAAGGSAAREAATEDAAARVVVSQGE